LKTALINAAIVGSGGFIGAVCRYGLSGLVQRYAGLTTFPWGTLVVNMAGCLAIGVAVGLMDSRQLFGPEFRLFALIGLLGGFTTYSTFGYETFALLRDAEYMRALFNVGIQVVLGLVLVWAGYSLASR
jgi:CrcB protein